MASWAPLLHVANGPRHQLNNTNQVMITPLELMIVATGFGVVGLYLYFVSRFIRKAEKETAEADKAERLSIAA